MFFILQVWSFRLCALPTLYISCIIYYFSFRWGAVRFCFSFLLAKCLAHVFNVWWLGWEGMAVPMCSSTHNLFFRYTYYFFCLQDMVFLSWAHFFSSLLCKDFLVRFSPYQQTQKPLFWRPALTSSTTHFFASLMPHHSIFFTSLSKGKQILLKLIALCPGFSAWEVSRTKSDALRYWTN